MQGGRIVPYCGGHRAHVHGVVQQGSDRREAQEYVMRFGPTHTKVWHAGERLLHARPHCKCVRQVVGKWQCFVIMSFEQIDSVDSTRDRIVLQDSPECPHITIIIVCPVSMCGCL